MQRRRFILTALAATVFVTLAKATDRIIMSIKKGFNTRAGETRNGERFTMKGVTRNTLGLKIGSADTEGGMAVFEQI